MAIPTQPTTFDPSLVIITYGPYILSGFADDIVKVSRNSDTFKTVVGAAGDVARTRSADRTGSVEFTLMQTSASNDVLSAQAAKGELPASVDALPLQIKDLSGRSLMVAPNAWPRKLADLEFGKDQKPRKWVLDCDRVEMNVAGN